jgi:hypothetical protein
MIKNTLKHILTITAILLCGSACSDFLDEQNPNRVPAEEFYATEQDIVFAANGAYSTLRAAGFYRDMYLYTDIRSNSAGVQDPGGGNGTNYEFFNYTLKTDNSKLKAHWTDLFKCITRSNIVLDHIDGVPFDDENRRTTLRLEMRFLRALSYFNLVVQFGDVPIVTRELKTKEEIREHTRRSPKSEVYELIESDLTAVIAGSLPDLQTGTGIGRASKVAAYALSGKLLLHKAADPDFASSRAANLQKAKTHLSAAWNLKPFASLASIPYADVFDKTRQVACQEIIFQVMYQGGNSAASSIYAYTFQPTGEPGLTSLRNGGGVNLPTAEMMNEYEADDPRRELSVGVSPRKQNYVKKYTDLGDVNGYGANSWIVLRYADVALLLAEVKMHLNEPDAPLYLNFVRERAGLPASNIPNLRDAIAHERKVELAFEGQSWYDLIRLYSRAELKALMQTRNPNFADKDFLLPVPYDEHKLDPERMYQNEGY